MSHLSSVDSNHFDVLARKRSGSRVKAIRVPTTGSGPSAARHLEREPNREKPAHWVDRANGLRSVLAQRTERAGTRSAPSITSVLRAVDVRAIDVLPSGARAWSIRT